MRPTLENQIEVSKLTEEELVKLLTGNTFWKRIDFRIFCHAKLLWSVLHWNWFNIYTGQRGLWMYLKAWFKGEKLN